MALIDPPYALAPLDALADVSALQLMQGASLTLTLSPLAVVAAQVLELFLVEAVARLHAYAPT
jgi:hypothetical protein